MESTHVFCVPGKHYIIDEVHPVTGRSMINGLTLEQIRARPGDSGAQIMAYVDWQAQRAAQQDTPVTWTEITAERHNDMLEVLPPIYGPQGFLVSEACDHHALTGRPRYDAFISRGGKHYASSRPLTVAEFRSGKWQGPQFRVCVVIQPRRAWGHQGKCAPGQRRRNRCKPAAD